VPGTNSVLILSFKPGHDGSVAAIRDGVLLYSLESEKDSFGRHASLTPNTVLEIAECLDELPDIVALGGWQDSGCPKIRGVVGAGYEGLSFLNGKRSFFGKQVRYFSSTHERSHVLGAIGMAPDRSQGKQVVLVWEGLTGAFYLVSDRFQIECQIPVLDQPGSKYAALFALCDPGFPDHDCPDFKNSGKLMALAAFGDASSPTDEVRTVVEALLRLPSANPFHKGAFAGSPLYACGVQSQLFKDAAALLTARMFEIFAGAAIRHLPAGLPLRISGGCGLNCDWNSAWARLGHFSSVFVPPCPNDSGSAIGTAIDALTTETGQPYIDWSVYSGLDFELDCTPDPAQWSASAASDDGIAEALANGRVVAWVQGRWEIGPRALGNRSLLAEPYSAATRDRLNAIKARESYRPIAPCCRVEDLAVCFEEAFEDPYMLYFRKVRDPRLQAVTHVDGSARTQTVSAGSNTRLHLLLSAFARRSGLGILCNTSLNFKGHGFLNRMSDLVAYCQERNVTDFVVGDVWYRSRRLT
jgi:hydroxymethyl cephem carbamoyltransferase